MDIKMEIKEIDDKWVFNPIGDIDIYTSMKFREEVMKCFEKENKDILIDGTKLDYIDSVGLGALIFILKNIQEKGFKVYLDNLKPNIVKLLTITELDKLLVIRGESNE